jgi:hypothetical protein
VLEDWFWVLANGSVTLVQEIMTIGLFILADSVSSYQVGFVGTVGISTVNNLEQFVEQKVQMTKRMI